MRDDGTTIGPQRRPALFPVGDAAPDLPGTGPAGGDGTLNQFLALRDGGRIRDIAGAGLPTWRRPAPSPLGGGALPAVPAAGALDLMRRQDEAARARQQAAYDTARAQAAASTIQGGAVYSRARRTGDLSTDRPPTDPD